MRARCVCSVGILLASIATAGCLRVLSLDYQATNSVRGQGTVHVSDFHYQAADEQRVRPHEVETPPRSEAKLFLSESIGVLFSQALQSELVRSGYTVTESSSQIITGVVTRFLLDWTKETELTFMLDVAYLVESDGRQPFSWHCASLKNGPAGLEADAVLIRAGIADCIEHFLLAARDAKVL